MELLKFESPAFDEIFSDAARRFHQEPNGGLVLRNHDGQLVDDALSLLVNALPLDRRRLRISQDRLVSALRHELMRRRTHASPAADFKGDFPSFKRLLTELPLQPFEVWIPLPLTGGPTYDAPAWRLAELDFIPQTHEAWHHAAQRAGEDLPSLLERTHHHFDERTFTPYKTVVQARDAAFAVGHCIDLLEIVLGMVNWARHYRLDIPRRFGGDGSLRWSNLRVPFVYLLASPNRESVDVYRHDDDGPRPPVDFTGLDREHYDRIFPRMSPVDAGTRYGQLRMAAYHHYYRGMTAASHADAFGHFWRGIEALAQTGHDESSMKNMDAMNNLLGFNRERVGLDFRFARMAYLRNNLVHKGTGEDIMVRDISFMAGVLAAAIQTYDQSQGRFSEEDLKFMMRQRPDIEILRHNKTTLEHHVRLLSELIGFREPDEAAGR